MPRQPFVTAETTKVDEATVVRRHLGRHAKDPGVQALAKDLDKQGFKPLKAGNKAFFGAEQTYKSSEGKTASFSIDIQSYRKAGSKDEAALGVATFTSGKDTETYRFTLVAPSGNFDKARERKVDPRNAVRDAKSWWTAFRDCSKRCGTPCAAALVSCTGTWTAYLWCLVATCGGCVLRCVACASCNCSVWCRWAAGCCRR